MFTPAATVSARPFVPHGVFEPSGGAGERAIGNVGRPSNRIVRLRSKVDVAPCPVSARQPKRTLAAARATSAIRARLLRDNSPHLLKLRREGNPAQADRKSTRLNSSHVAISYAVFC